MKFRGLLEIETSKWTNDITSGLEEKLTTKEEVEAMFPENEEFSAVRVIEDKEFKGIIYGRKKKGEKITFFDQFLAYHCSYCKKTYFGPPIVKEFSMDDAEPLAGQDGYTLNCHGCYRELKDGIVWES